MDFFRRVKDSFTNFEIYRDVAVQRRSETLKYFIMIFSLVFLIGGIRFIIEFNTGLSEITAAVREKIPEFTLSGGELKVEGPQPIVIDGENNGPVMIIDTTGQVDQSVLDEYTEGVFISRDKIVNKQAGQTNQIKFKEIPQFELNKQKVINYLPLLKWLLVVIGVMGYVFSLGWVLMTTLILALIGLMINSFRKGTLEFRSIWNIAVYAFTLPWLLEMVKVLAYPEMPMFGFIKWGIAVFILYKGIEAAGKPALPES